MRIENSTSERHSTCITSEREGREAVIVEDGKMFIPAESFRFAGRGKSGEEMDHCIMIMQVSEMGLYVPMVPEDCRNLAAQLIRFAEIAEATAARAADEILAKVRGGDGK